MNPEPQRPGNFHRVVVGSGHMIDAPGREPPRFPASKEKGVREAIASQLEQWKIMENDLALCGGACGADILFAEECLLRGASLRLLLAQAVNDFVHNSVARAGNDWVRRFYTLCRKAEVQILPASLARASDDVSIYERVNLWLVESAQQAASELYALLVWDEKPSGDGPGGTVDFEKRMRQLGSVIAIINPTRLSLGKNEE